MISLSCVDPEKQDVCMMSTRMLSDMIKGDTLLLSVSDESTIYCMQPGCPAGCFCVCAFSLSHLKYAIYGINICHGGLLTSVHLHE